MKRSRFAVLWRAFFAQFFASESVTSDQQLRYAMIGVLAFILAPCLLIMVEVFPQFQLLVIRVGGMHLPPGVVVRATAVRNINAEDMIEWFVSILVAYSMVTVGLIAAAAWDALSFDRRDAMVLGQLPIRRRTIVSAKVMALVVFLLGSSAVVNLLNAAIFAIETADQFGFRAAIAHFVACAIVTTAGAALVFSAVVAIRGAVAIAGGPRVAAATGSGLQFLFVVASLAFLITIFAPPAHEGMLALPTLTFWTPTVWFVAWFEGLRGADRGAWPEFVMLARRAQVAVAIAVAGAAAMSVVALGRQMQSALTPSAAPGPLGRARLPRAIARLLVGGHPRVRLKPDTTYVRLKPDTTYVASAFRRTSPVALAISDFILMTIARERTQQAPIAVNAAVGAAVIVLLLARARANVEEVLLAVPLILVYWVGIGLRAAFFVPSEIAAAWSFRFNAPTQSRQFWSAVRASAIGVLLPLALVCDAPLAFLVGVRAAAWHALLSAALAIVVAETIALTVDFVPFTRPYEPGHARLKTRWPLYLIGMYLAAFWPARAATQAAGDPPRLLAVAGSLLALALILELVGRRRARRWSLDPADEVGEELVVNVLGIGLVVPGASQ